MSMSKVDVLRAACCIAGIDEHIDDHELRMLRKLAEHVGVGNASLDAMMHRARTETDYYEDQFNLMCDDVDHALKVLFSVAVVDGELGDAERIMLQHFAALLGMTDARFDQLVRAAEWHVRKKRQQGPA